MKRIITICAAILMNASMFAQAPQKMSYQAVIRNSSNALVVSTPVGMRISILQGSSTGTALYIETQTPTTNANGLVSLEIGSGTVVSGTFASIDWANGPCFIKTETDPTGGTAYTIAGTNELMSVPYALHAKTAESVSATTYSVGDFAHGGIVFWVDTTGQHGLVCALVDQSTGIQWYNNDTNTITNAVRDGLGAGMYNTERIIASQSTGSYAAQLCANYQGGGYGDWYLPSKYELNLLYAQRRALVGGGFAKVFYWSSTESVAKSAWGHDFSDGYDSYDGGKFLKGWVRAVRAF
jgi:hypothetical protein